MTDTATPLPATEATNITVPTTLIKAESNTELNTSVSLSHSVSITGVADLQDVNVTSTDGKQNLCSASLGAKVLFATDEWFATADNLLKDTPPQFDEHAYCEQGKVMDGWETRRRREDGHDWCLIQLASPFHSTKSNIQLVGIEIDTAHFTGNHTPRVSIEIASMKMEDTMKMVKALPNGVERLLEGGVIGTGHTPVEVQQAKDAVNSMVTFQELLPQTPLNPGYEESRLHYYPVDAPLDGNLIKLNYFPDGGVARLKFWAVEQEVEEDVEVVNHFPKRKSLLYMPIESGPICTVVSHPPAHLDAAAAEMGIPSLYMPSEMEYEYPELSSQELGGTGLVCSNKHFGEPWRLIQSCMGKGMWDGWETARHPSRQPVLIKNPETNLIDSPLNDWCILKLGQPAASGVARVILDTKHFLGNYPESVLLEGCCWEEGDNRLLDSATWFPLVQRTRMSPNAEHVFERSKEQLLNSTEPVTHVRLSIFPDGGVSRVRIYG
eukprot:scaffold4782_cov106-Cylindrotheca_fusiformis.AAC.5